MNSFSHVFNATLVATCVLTACGGSSGEASVKVAAELNTLACVPTSGIRVADLRRSLENSGIAVAQTTCGFYNFNHVAVCGPPDGALAFFEVPLSKAPLVIGLGFFVAAERPLAIDYGPCLFGQ